MDRLKRGYQSLSEKYRAQKQLKLSEEEIEAYEEARFPATYAVCSKVFKELQSAFLKEQYSMRHLLDIGSGPGTGSLAGCAIFDEIKKVTLIERDPRMLQKAKQKIKEEGPAIEALYVLGDFCHMQEREKKKEDTSYDLALFSYSLGEMAKKKEALTWAFSNAPICLIIEPGTPRGFETILAARELLISLGGHLIAPCPHALRCPLEGAEEEVRKKSRTWGWCHFGAHVERSKRHRQLKGGSLGWEEEKYCYLAATSLLFKASKDRLLRPLTKSSGMVKATCCSSSGEVKEYVVLKREKEKYKEVLKLKWGDERCFEDQ